MLRARISAMAACVSDASMWRSSIFDKIVFRKLLAPADPGFPVRGGAPGAGGAASPRAMAACSMASRTLTCGVPPPPPPPSLRLLREPLARRADRYGASRSVLDIPNFTPPSKDSCSLNAEGPVSASWAKEKKTTKTLSVSNDSNTAPNQVMKAGVLVASLAAAPHGHLVQGGRCGNVACKYSRGFSSGIEIGRASCRERV